MAKSAGVGHKSIPGIIVWSFICVIRQLPPNFETTRIIQLTLSPARHIYLPAGHPLRNNYVFCGTPPLSTLKQVNYWLFLQRKRYKTKS